MCYKWSITFKNCESLYVHLYNLESNYTSIKINSRFTLFQIQTLIFFQEDMRFSIYIYMMLSKKKKIKGMVQNEALRI